MKIRGAGPGAPEAASGPTEPAGAGEAAGGDEARGAGFAERLERAGAQDPAAQSRGVPGATGSRPAAATEAASPSAVAAISAELRAGRLTPEKALDRVIDHILDRQVGPQASPEVREKIGAALRDALENDPLLVEKVRALSGR